MQNDERSPTDAMSAPGSKPDDSGRVQLSANMTRRLEKLAPWRISPSRIKFPESGRHFEGGYATVSQAFLGSSPGDAKDQLAESSGGSPGPNLPRPEGADECREAEGSNEEPKPMDGGEAERQDQAFDDEASSPQKVSSGQDFLSSEANV
ncbi:hypothetical protein M407DRAFT_27512 [Tulasnella calospora MUT 4182]|uniref:Uncharacterized protein n=1 Tax=Tulasnella calospora MUT 4182 TaxID=1051891 RepID=A0A0C3QDS6_9AGAM|nr:hypothetical protein M407DRAFT_27512 [Tulasnella calospora MUT 4182]